MIHPVVLTQVGDGVCVDVSRKRFLSLDVGVGNATVFQSEAFQLTRFRGKVPVNLHRCLVQNLGEETGRSRH